MSVAYSRAAAKISSVDRSVVAKGLGTTSLVYIFQTFNVDIKNCLRLSAFPDRQCVAYEKFKPEVFGKQTYCIEVLVTLFGLFGVRGSHSSPGNCALAHPGVTPLLLQKTTRSNKL